MGNVLELLMQMMYIVQSVDRGMRLNKHSLYHTVVVNLKVKHGCLCPQIFTNFGEKRAFGEEDVQPWLRCMVSQCPRVFHFGLAYCITII